MRKVKPFQMTPREQDMMRNLQDKVLAVLGATEADDALAVAPGLPTVAEMRNYLYPEHHVQLMDILYEMTGRRS